MLRALCFLIPPSSKPLLKFSQVEKGFSTSFSILLRFYPLSRLFATRKPFSAFPRYLLFESILSLTVSLSIFLSHLKYKHSEVKNHVLLLSGFTTEQELVELSWTMRKDYSFMNTRRENRIRQRCKEPSCDRDTRLLVLCADRRHGIITTIK